MALELRVTRHPFSFIGDQDQSCDALNLKRQGTWKDRLLDYTGGNPYLRDQAMEGMKQAGKPLGIQFDYNCFINRQPVDSQRMLLYAARHGKQEDYMTALNKRHFEQGTHGESASKRHTVLAAAKEAGLDYDDAARFHDSDELREVVWRSYGDMPRRGINAIPLFVFNVPEIDLEGGPLRPEAAARGAHEPPIVNGSMGIELFERIFDDLWDQVEARRVAEKKRRAILPPKTPMPATSAPLPDSLPVASPTGHAAAAAGTADALAEIAARGGNVGRLLALARADQRGKPLHETLKALGYAKVGERMRMAARLAEEAQRREGTGGDRASAAQRKPVSDSAPKPRPSKGPLTGCRVILVGLNARPDLNGKHAQCGSLDEAKGRYAVRLVDGSESLSIKAANLQEVATPDPAPTPAAVVASATLQTSVVEEFEEEEELVMF